MSIVSRAQSLALNLSSTHDFDYLYNDVDDYTIAKFYSQEAAAVLRSATATEIKSQTNANRNVTADMEVHIQRVEGGPKHVVAISEIPMIVKYRTARLQKDCNLNRVGKWNHTDRHCYAYKQTTSLCLVLDDDLRLIEDYEHFKCNSQTSQFLQQTKLLWTNKEGEPWLDDHTADVSVTVRHRMDPFSRAMIELELTYDQRSGTLVFLGIVLFVVGFLLLLVPIRILCLKKEEDDRDIEKRTLRNYNWL